MGLFLGVLQVGVAVHVRGVLTAAAAEGARRSAISGPDDGAARARSAVADALSPATAARMTYEVRRGTSRGLPVVEVVVRGPLPLVGVPSGPLRVTVRGHAVQEPR